MRMHQGPLEDEATFIKEFIQELTSERMFFEIAECLGCLGIYDETQGSFHVKELIPSEELDLSLSRLLMEMYGAWPSVTVARSILQVERPGTLAVLVQSIDSWDGTSISDRIRAAQSYIAETLDRVLAQNTPLSKEMDAITGHRDLCAFLKSEEVVSQILNDMETATNQWRNQIDFEKELLFVITWCIENGLRPYWHFPPVAKVLQWLTRNPRLLHALKESPHCAPSVSCPERIAFVCELCSSLVERAAS